MQHLSLWPRTGCLPQAAFLISWRPRDLLPITCQPQPSAEHTGWPIRCRQQQPPRQARCLHHTPPPFTTKLLPQQQRTAAVRHLGHAHSQKSCTSMGQKAHGWKEGRMAGQSACPFNTVSSCLPIMLMLIDYQRCLPFSRRLFSRLSPEWTALCAKARSSCAHVSLEQVRGDRHGPGKPVQ